MSLTAEQTRDLLTNEFRTTVKDLMHHLHVEVDDVFVLYEAFFVSYYVTCKGDEKPFVCRIDKDNLSGWDTANDLRRHFEYLFTLKVKKDEGETYRPVFCDKDGNLRNHVCVVEGEDGE